MSNKNFYGCINCGSILSEDEITNLGKCNNCESNNLFSLNEDSYKVLTNNEKILKIKVDEVGNIAAGKLVGELLIRYFNKYLNDNAVGLAANQLGINAKVFICLNKHSISTENKFNIFANPTIEEAYDEFITLEGCLSIPNKQFKVKRYGYVETKDIINGNVVTGGDTNDKKWIAACVQHEIDHLNGILISDKEVKPYITNTKNNYKPNDRVTIVNTITKEKKIIKFKKLNNYSNDWKIE